MMTCCITSQLDWNMNNFIKGFHLQKNHYLMHCETLLSFCLNSFSRPMSQLVCLVLCRHGYLAPPILVVEEVLHQEEGVVVVVEEEEGAESRETESSLVKLSELYRGHLKVRVVNIQLNNVFFSSFVIDINDMLRHFRSITFSHYVICSYGIIQEAILFKTPRTYISLSSLNWPMTGSCFINSLCVLFVPKYSVLFYQWSVYLSGWDINLRSINETAPWITNLETKWTTIIIDIYIYLFIEVSHIKYLYFTISLNNSQ